MKIETIRLKQAGLAVLMIGLGSDVLLADTVTNFFTNFNSFLQNNVAPAIALSGILVACVFIAFGKREGIHKAINALVAGAIAAGAVGIYSLITNFAR